MLSKLFTSARTLLDRSSQASAPELSQPQITAEPANEMVTTRRQSGQHTVDGSDAGQTTPTQAPSSSRKRQIPSSDSEGSDSVENEEGESPATKKQKVLPVRGKDDKELKRSTRVAVEIPVSRVGLDRTSPIDPSRKEPQEEFHTSGSVEAAEVSSSYQSRLEIPDSESDGEDPELGEGVERPADSTIRQKQTKTYTASPSASKAKHKRFGSEESEVMVLSTAVEQKETDDESSDDDAPEVVGAQDALKQAKRKELEAAKAIEERESAIRKKRKERDVILKRQASNKRKREGDLELHRKKSGRKNSGEGDGQDDEEAQTSNGTAPTLQLGLGNRLPEFLPEEYLEDNESDEEMELEPVKRAKRAKKTKFTELIEKKPKDIRKGSTTYRVVEARSTKLAPKSSSNARSVKESWLQGRTGSSRKSFSGGFFKAR